jgi:8-oxo-dGTP pyrophosphatase MutT (NUDIX family)
VLRWLTLLRRGRKRVPDPLDQYGALPFRWSDDGSLKVMLVTTRGRKRWMIPKGWPVPGLAPHESAAREAYEEAGLIGLIHPEAAGSFKYVKRLSLGREAKCIITVFPLEVEYQKDHWPEQGEREAKWFSIKRAASLVSEPGLRQILMRFDPKEALGTSKLKA